MLLPCVISALYIAPSSREGHGEEKGEGLGGLTDLFRRARAIHAGYCHEGCLRIHSLSWQPSSKLS
jgi:hypothetical protein